MCKSFLFSEHLMCGILKKMKKTLILILSLTFILTGCASKPAEESNKNELSLDTEVELTETETVEVEQKVIIAHFDDWKYKGFGYEIPLWVEPAVNNEKEQVVKFSGIEGADVTTINTLLFYGVNLDHAEKRSEESKKDSEWELKDSFWVRINKDFEDLEEPYVLVQLFVKK